MSEESDRIVVSTDKLARCQWCGSPQSNEWVYSEKGGIFCSYECEIAAGARKAWITSLILLIGSILIVIPYVVTLSLGNIMMPLGGFELFFWGIMMLFASIAGFVFSFEGSKYRDRKGKYFGTSPIECEYCRHSNPPSATRCLNCDATLTNAPFTSEEIPPWIQKHKRVTGVKCPHCNAVYSYLPPMISVEGSAACQNCNRQIYVATTESSHEQIRSQY